MRDGYNINVPIPTKLTPVLSAMEANLHGHIAFIPSHTPGMRVLDTSEALLVDSGLPTDTFNKIVRANLMVDTIPNAKSFIEYFRRFERPFSWWVGPGSRPFNLESSLKECGLQLMETEAGMAMELSELPEKPAIPSGLEVRWVRTEAELAEFAAINAANWQPPDAAVLEFFQRAAPLVLQADSPMRFLMGYIDGEPAGALELFTGGGVAGLHMVSTREQFRGRGIAYYLCWFALQAAREQGFTTGTLQAAPEGFSIYKRLGFREVCQLAEYG